VQPATKLTIACPLHIFKLRLWWFFIAGGNGAQSALVRGAGRFSTTQNCYFDTKLRLFTGWHCLKWHAFVNGVSTRKIIHSAAFYISGENPHSKQQSTLFEILWNPRRLSIFGPGEDQMAADEILCYQNRISSSLWIKSTLIQ